MEKVKVGIIGGSGLGHALCGKQDGTPVTVSTPFGEPSGAILETRWGNTDIALLNRHGAGHMFSPTNVPYRANIYALKAVGCTHVIASGAVGSLREKIRPKDLVIPDQIIDKTTRRAPGGFLRFRIAREQPQHHTAEGGVELILLIIKIKRGGKHRLLHVLVGAVITRGHAHSVRQRERQHAI